MNKAIQQYIDKHYESLGSGTYWLNTLDDADGQPCLRTWALHKLKGKKPAVKEVVREYLNEDIYVHGDLYFMGAAGWRVNWGNHKHYSYYMNPELDDNWYLVDLKQRPGMSSIRLFKNSELIQIFKKYIPYFYMSEDLNIMEYARRYKEFPDAEKLAKAGFEYLVMDKRILKLSNASKKKFVSWLLQPINSDYVKSHHPLYNDITRAIKNGWTMEKYYYEEAIDIYEENFKQAHIRRTREQCEEVYNYLNGRKSHPIQLIGLHDYIDYLKIAKEMGFNMRLKSVVYPRDARQAHDNLVKTKKAVESKTINETLGKIAKILKGYEIKRKDLKIVFPSCQKDFIDWGKKLSICVGTYGYDKKMVKGESIILMVYCKDSPLECCELIKKDRSKGLQICQLRGAHNFDSPRHEECKSLVNTFIRNYKNQQLIGACI